MAAIGGWTLLERVGEGSVAVVWRARDASGREAALKVLRDQRLDDPDVRSRVRQEIRILAALDHPNVAGLLDHGELAESHVKRLDPVSRLWLALEWVAGGDLGDAVAGKPLAAERVVAIGSQIAAALGAAHALGIVHRDLTASNVRLREDGVAKLVDFGFAKVLEGGDEALGQRTHATGLGSVLGTAPWLAPEQLEGEAVDARTDIHALGVLLYLMSTGAMPFGGRNVLEVLQRVLSAQRPRPSAAGSRMGEAFDALVTACMARDPAARPAAVAEVGRVLREIV